jgi:peptidoglycan hydrolase-like protein with peptidoglycan-binding domain
MADTATEPTLRFGDSGADGWVEYLQQLLTHQGHPAEVTGAFDDATREAVLAFQRRAGLLVDAVVGNQTWAALRNEAPQPIGTDGREPGTFEEQGAEARWFTEPGPPIFDADRDLLGLPAISTGDTPIASGKFTADATITSEATGESQSFVLGSATETGEPAQPGEFVFFVASGWQQLPDGTYTVTATLPAELGADQAEFRFQKGEDPGTPGGGGGETGLEFGIAIARFEADSDDTEWTGQAIGSRGGAGTDLVVWATDDGAEMFTSDVPFEVGPGGQYSVELATPSNIRSHWDAEPGRSFTVTLTTNSGANSQGEMDNASIQVPGWSGGV